VLDGLMQLLEAVDMPEGELESRVDETVQGAQVLLDADGAALMLLTRSNGYSVAGASTPQAEALERAQSELGDGPGVESTRRRKVVSVSDLRDDPRWPALAAAAREQGLCAVLSAPIWLQGRPAGNLNLFQAEPREWSRTDAQTLAAYAGIVTAFLRIALESRHAGTVADALDVFRTGD